VCDASGVNWVGLRNAAIIAAIAVLGVVWTAGFGSLAVGLSQIILVIFVFAALAWGYQYFRQNQLAWLVLKAWQKGLIIGAAIGIALLVLVGFPLLSEYITQLGVIALIGVLVLLIVWVIRESRRFP
jgi:hypothetical protein